MDLSPGTLLRSGTYRVEELLSRGGFGSTYRAHDLALNREVAIKVCSGEALLGFLEEARLLASFDHPDIVKVHAVFEEGGAGYLVMELLTGHDLQQLVERDGALPIETALDYIRRAARAVEVLHARSVLHRDLKPGNLFLTSEGRLVLLDFGSARPLGKSHHTAIVTPGYAPPEQYGTGLRPGPWSDIYSLAATLVHLVTGAPPPEVVERLTRDTFRLPAGLPAQVARALALDPSERPATVGELIEGLETGVAMAGHQGRVTALAYYGNLLASAGEDRQVLLWHGAPRLHTLHDDWVNALAFGPDGLLASGGNDRQIFVGKPVAMPREVLSLVWSGGLFAGLRDGRLACLRGEQVTLYQPGLRGGIGAMAAVGGERLALAASPSSKVFLFHPPSGELVALEGHRSAVRCLAYQGDLLASGDSDGHLCLWRQGRLEAGFKAHHGAIHALAFRAGRLVSASQDGTLGFWGEPEQRLDLEAGELCALAVAEDGRLAVGTMDGRILTPPVPSRDTDGCDCF
ncbi:MAG: WD40 repeat domain-containing serine/threonine protein kinase [Vulcanimicrobiota bacterium]